MPPAPPEMRPPRSKSLVRHLEPGIRYILNSLQPINLILGTLFSVLEYALRSVLGKNWLLNALAAYLIVPALFHSVLVYGAWSRSRRWPPQRLTLVLINWAAVVVIVAAYLLFPRAVEVVQGLMFLTMIGVFEYFSNYRHNRRAIRREFKRFISELGITR